MTTPGVIAAGIPQIPGDLDQLTEHSLGLQTTGPALGQTGSDVHTTFQGLATCYHAPEAGTLFAATLPVRDIAVALGEEIVVIGRALGVYADTVRPLQTRLRELQAEAEALAATPPADPTATPDPAVAERETALMREVNAAVAAWHEAQRVCASAITALNGAPGYRPDNGDGHLDPGEYGFTTAQLDALTAAGQPLPWGTPTEVDQGFLGDLLTGWHGFAIDGFWADITGLGSLVGITPDGGHDWALMGQAWGAIGNLTIIGYVDDMLRGEMNPLEAVGTMYSAWGPVLGSLIALDEWEHNPAGALGQTIYNVGTAPLAILKAAKPAAAAARVTGAGLGAAGRKVLDALTRMPTVDEILRHHADRLNLHPRFGAMPAIVGDGPGGHRFDIENPSPGRAVGGPGSGTGPPDTGLPRRSPSSTTPHPEMTAAERSQLDATWDRAARSDPETYDRWRLGDPAHQGRSGRNQEIEATIALDMRSRGELPASVERPTNPELGDFIDPSTGRMWDVKGFYSDWPDHVPPDRRLTPFPERVTPEKFRNSVMEELAATGDRRVILNSRNLDQEAIGFMQRIIAEEGWGGRVVWYP